MSHRLAARARAGDRRFIAQSRSQACQDHSLLRRQSIDVVMQFRFGLRLYFRLQSAFRAFQSAGFVEATA
jgi:hypothetical protein